MNFGLQLFLVGLGGAVGSIGRFVTGNMVEKFSVQTGFPVGTLVVNCVGCFAIGLIGGPGVTMSEERRFLLQVGLLGGFTTFSAFGLESVTLLRDGLYGRALLNVSLQLGLGLGAAAFGMWLARSA